MIWNLPYSRAGRVRLGFCERHLRDCIRLTGFRKHTRMRLRLVIGKSPADRGRGLEPVGVRARRVRVRR
jgi:hypothetical protein